MYKLLRYLPFFCSFIIRYIFVRQQQINRPEKLEKIQYHEKGLLSNYRKKFPNLVREKRTKNKNSNKIKIGFFYVITGSISFQSSIFKNVPENIEIFLYDLKYTEKIDEELKKYNYNEYQLKMDHSRNGIINILKRIFEDKFDWKKVVTQINKDKVDILLTIPSAFCGFTHQKVIEGIDTPYIIDISAGNIPTFNNRIDLHGQIQLPPYYEIKEHRLYSHKLKGNLNTENFRYMFFYAKRDIELPKLIALEDKKDIIFIHSRLSKLSNDWLEVISEILLINKTTSLCFMGNETEYLSDIESFFKKKSLFERVHYLGYYDISNVDNTGKIIDKGWLQAIEYLKESKVMVDTFPANGGSTKIEAYLSGLPVISLEDNYYDVNKSFDTFVNIQSIVPKSGMAHSRDEYIQKVTRILNNDTSLYNNIIIEQKKLSRKFTDEKYLWDTILNNYRREDDNE
ncbi:MAG: hypothetical protein ACNI28_03675 [Arcobacter sp.]|uniref:hypothetical protein n=1 Tax=Arcobacter sp. TaxID=1872629 RepID=UPI003B00B89F